MCVCLSLLFVPALAIMAQAPGVAVPTERPEPETGMISGIVVDASNHPVAGIIVFADPVKPGPGCTPGAKTDRQGRFTIPMIPAGVVTLVTENPAAGYAYTRWSGFWSVDTPTPPTVTVAAQETVEGIVVHVGRPVGVVSLTVLDQRGEPVTMAWVRPIREDSPEWFWACGTDTAGKCVLALPPVPFTLLVTADGFLDWRSDDADAVPEHQIMLRTDERRELTIVLEARVRR